MPARIVRPSVVAGKSYVLAFEYNSRGQPLLLSEIGHSPSPSDALQPVRIARATRFAYFEQADGVPQLVGKLKSIDGPSAGSSDMIRYEYDARGLLLAAHHPLGAIESYQYDAWGRLEQMTPLDGIPVRLEYDTTGRATAFVRAGQRSAVSYDEQGRVATMADPVGQRFKFEYDGASRLTSLTDTDGFRVVLDIDADGRATAQRLLNPDGSVSLEIEASPEELLLARELQQSKWSAALSTMLRLPSVSEWNSSADAALAPFYAALNSHAMNEQFAVGDERGLVSEYVYDDFNRLVRVENADSGTVYFAYDSSNRLRFRRGADNSVTEYRYDSLARPTHIITRDETVAIEYGKFSKPSGIRYAAGREEYRYDAAGRIRERVRFIDDKGFRTAYTYDQLGRLATSTLPDGQQLVYRYNASVAAKPGILNAILRKDLLGTTVIVDGLNEAADRFDRQTSRFGNGLEFTRTLDRKGQITRFGTKGVAEFDFAMTEEGRIATARADYVQRYLYDDSGRVTAAASGVGIAARQVLGLAYDDADNILSRVHSEAIERFAIDDFSNRILHREDADGTRTMFEYDAAGRTSKVGERAYRYDGAGRISEVFDGQRRVAQYSYNAFGERIKKVSYNGDRTSVTYFFHDGAKLTAEADGTGTITKHYVYVENRPVAVLVDREIYAVHTDWRGAPLALTDENRQVVWRAEVGLWHEAQVTHAAVELNLRGSNQYFDAETGLHYNYHRYFDPQVGRYLTPDPIGQAGGLNLYAFVEGDAANNIDPLGLNPRNPDSLPDNTSVANWSMADRIGYTLRVAVPLMPAGIRDALRDMVTSPTAAAAFGAIVLFMASNPAGWVLTAVTAVASIAVALFAWDLIKGIIASVRAVANARCVGDLVSAGQSLATTTSNALVGGVASWLGAGLAVRAGRALRGAFDAARRLMPARPPAALPPQPSGVWGRNPFQRGRDIEAELNRRATASNPANRATPTNNYPVIDRWNPNTGLATSVKSIDINSATYQTPANLSARIREYVGTLSRFNGTTHGGLRTNGLIRSRELEIAIPRAASGAQQTVINNMIAYARGLNPPVTIRIVVYP
jgi:RHS repeat-associated protein